MRFAQNAKQLFQWLLKRMGIFYLVLFLAVYMCVDVKSIWATARLRALNRIMPSFDRLAGFAIGDNVSLTRSEWQEYARYYKKVVDLYPERNDGTPNFFLGFCQAHLGKSKKAIKNFQLAAENNPVFFWISYDLGLEFYNRKDYAQAVDWLQRAISFKGALLKACILNSKIYFQISAADDIQDYDFQESFYQAFGNAYLVIAKSHYLDGDYQKALNIVYYVFSKNISFSSDFYRIAGLSLKQQGMFREAAGILQAGLDRTPADVNLLADLQGVLKAAGLDEPAQRVSEAVHSVMKYMQPSDELFQNEALKLF